MFHTAMAVTAPKVAGVATGTFAVLYLLFFITPPSPWRWLLLAPTVAFASFLWTVSLLSALGPLLGQTALPYGVIGFSSLCAPLCIPVLPGPTLAGPVFMCGMSHVCWGLDKLCRLSPADYKSIRHTHKHPLAALVCGALLGVLPALQNSGDAMGELLLLLMVQVPSSMFTIFWLALYGRFLRTPASVRPPPVPAKGPLRRLMRGWDGRHSILFIGCLAALCACVASATSLHSPGLWSPPAGILGFVSFVYLVESIWLFAHRPPPPAQWASLERVTDPYDRARLLELVATTSQEHAQKYDFDVKVVELHRVITAEHRARFDAYCAKLQARGKESNVELLFHGTSADGARSICEGDFRLPTFHRHGGMFGSGVYFANCPLKSMQYCTRHPYLRARTMLLCDVALGRTLQETKQARPRMSAENLKRMSTSEAATSAPPPSAEPPSASTQLSYNSITATRVVRVPEFVV